MRISNLPLGLAELRQIAKQQKIPQTTLRQRIQYDHPETLEFLTIYLRKREDKRREDFQKRLVLEETCAEIASNSIAELEQSVKNNLNM